MQIYIFSLSINVLVSCIFFLNNQMQLIAFSLIRYWMIGEVTLKYNMAGQMKCMRVVQISRAVFGTSTSC